MAGAEGVPQNPPPGTELSPEALQDQRRTGAHGLSAAWRRISFFLRGGEEAPPNMATARKAPTGFLLLAMSEISVGSVQQAVVVARCWQRLTFFLGFF